MRRGVVAITTALLPSFRSFTYRCSPCKALPPRLQNVFDLAISCDKVVSVADIGTDHGWLALELAKQFQQVVGIDKSEQALQDGALARDTASHNIDFRVGNGLQGLRLGESDVVCIAGMGVHTMCEILNPPQLETLDTRHLILQPTNSRPRHLMLLYDFVRHHGWSVQDEHILYTQRRWYITTRFDKSSSTEHGNLLPGSVLCKKASMQKVFSDYVTHHIQWIQQDRTPTGEISKEDQRWLEMFAKQ